MGKEGLKEAKFQSHFCHQRRCKIYGLCLLNEEAESKIETSVIDDKPLG